MDDAGIGRDDAKILERGLAPTQESVALLVALKFEEGIEIEGARSAELVDLNGVVDDEVGGDERIGEFGIGAHGSEGVAHGGEVDNAGHAGEILEKDAGGAEIDFFRRAAGVPFRYVFDVGVTDGAAFFRAQ